MYHDPLQRPECSIGQNGKPQRSASSQRNTGKKCNGWWRQNFEPLTTGVRKTMTIIFSSTLIYPEPLCIFDSVSLSGLDFHDVTDPWLFLKTHYLSSRFEFWRFVGACHWYIERNMNRASDKLAAGRRRNHLVWVLIGTSQSKKNEVCFQPEGYCFPSFA